MTDWDESPEGELPPGDGTPDAVVETFCPYCGEPAEVVVDLDGGGRQDYVEDCPVCCRPWHVTVRIDAGGRAHVRLRAEDES